jgi:hypothetical protein
MKLLGDRTTLVLAGAWNPAILSPNWIGRHILGLAPGNAFQVEMLLPVQGQAGSARLTFEGLSITPAAQALMFHIVPEDAGMVTKSFDVALRILKLLPHTPVGALGVNFAYQVEPLEGQLAKTVAWADNTVDLIVDDPEAKVLNRHWQLGIAAMGHMVNVGYRSDAQGATIDVNHHYEVEGSAERAAEHLAVAGLFDGLLNMTNKLVEGLVKGDA